MGLLRKNLILAGIASIAMVGFLNSSSAAALDGFLFSDIINQQQAQSEQLLSYLNNPFSVSTDYEVANPEGTINRNETLSTNLLFNKISDGEKLWGHDGKGIIFADSDNLINGNPQLKTAKRGDTLTFSVKLEAEDYYDAAETDPITKYQIVALLSKGLTLDQSSISVKIGDQELAQDQYELFHQDGASMGSAFQDFSAMVGPDISIDGSLGQLAGKTIELSLSATIDQDAPSEIFVRSAYAFDHQGGVDISEPDYMTNETYQAKALLDGNILIRRVDADGNPLAGARYTVDGVKANVEDETNNIYVYDENGSVTEFITNNEGKVIIKSAPMGEYTVREVQAPQGHETKEPVITKPGYENTQEIEYGDQKYIFNYVGIYKIDITKLMGRKTLDDGRTIISAGDLEEALWGGVQGGDSRYDDECSLVAETNEYKCRISTYTIFKTENGYALAGRHKDTIINEFKYSQATDRLMSFYRVSDALGKEELARREYLEISGSNATVVLAPEQYSLVKNEDDNCFGGSASTMGYTGQLVDSELLLCQTGSGYRLEIQRNDGLIGSYPFVYDEESGKYLVEFDVMFYSIEEETDDKLSVNHYSVVDYSPEFNRYYMSFGTGDQTAIQTERDRLLVSEFLFRDGATDFPENISNPQTADAILKAIIIATIGLAPIFILRKQLSKRAN